jgi:hypothetical protein
VAFMTHGDDVRSGAVQSAVQPEGSPDPDRTVQACAPRAYSVAPALPDALQPARPLATQGDVEQGEIVTGFFAALDNVRAKFDRIQRGAAVPRIRPLSVAEIHEQHRLKAARHQGLILRWLRHAWGGLHTGAAALAYSLLWALFSPAGFILLAGVIAICWFWL